MSYIGTTEIGKMFLGSTGIIKAYLGSNLVFQRNGGGGGGGGGSLPAGYKELTYVESAKFLSTYINTGIAVSNTTGFSVDAVAFDSLNHTTGAFGCLFGGRTDSNSSDFQLTSYSSGSSYQGTFRRGGSSQNYNAHLVRGSRFTASLVGDTLTSNGTTITTTSAISSSNYLYLFALNNGGTEAQYSNTRIYSFEVTDNSVSVLQYVPCVRESDKVIGFYDMVGNTFVPPTQGALLGYDDTSTQDGKDMALIFTTRGAQPSTSAVTRIRVVLPIKQGDSVTASSSMGQGVAASIYQYLGECPAADTSYLQELSYNYTSSLSGTSGYDGYLCVSLAKVNDGQFSQSDIENYISALNLAVIRNNH